MSFLVIQRTQMLIALLISGRKILKQEKFGCNKNHAIRFWSFKAKVFKAVDSN